MTLIILAFLNYQKLSNEVLFEDHSEAYAKCMNSFLERNKERCNNYFLAVITDPLAVPGISLFLFFFPFFVFVCFLCFLLFFCLFTFSLCSLPSACLATLPVINLSLVLPSQVSQDGKTLKILHLGKSMASSPLRFFFLSSLHSPIFAFNSLAWT